ncbi:hypothetical protein Patl1_15743 [Pistacia atlantica]|uniref:Uncharacterized protein n=1 Tax=Pistacia atlantica TaxID=434234 RepID=A0ACC1BAS8_9ROSI|nr:hypothetical protein Patl1_15743 [Pistacia atlantica]
MSERNDCHSAKVSSWQIPNEVKKLRKKQDDGISKDHLTSMPSITITIEKAFAPIALSAPTVNTGGHDATTLRTLGAGIIIYPGFDQEEVAGTRNTCYFLSCYVASEQWPRIKWL